MPHSRLPSAALDQAIRLLGTASEHETAIRRAAWVAHCVGRGKTSPLTPEAVTALAATLGEHRAERGSVIFHGDRPSTGVWIVRHGRVELFRRFRASPYRRGRPAAG